MEFAAIPWVQGSLVTLALAVIVSGFWMVFKGHLVPRSHVEDVRADRDARIAQAEKDRDERVAEAEKDAEQWRSLFEQERSAHEATRQAYAEETRAVLLASTEGAQIAAALLTEIRTRQIEA
ncbi:MULTISPECIES: hypothetical protein [Streptosporangium]|uniref:F0F1 ATP synthase subunit B n=1 Tax=Streptosporangium jomthongense TaxID=1193683 RepID=A0ABV8FG77_9ACTN